MPVLGEDTGQILGTVSGILIHPDTGVIEGVFVHAPGFFSHEDLFLGVVDILHWGMRITVRSADVLSPLEDRVRLQPLLAGDRPILGQRMMTESGMVLGRCRDVQFSTKDFRLEWLFPKRFFQWKIPVPASQILEVRRDVVVIKEATPTEKENAPDVLSLVPPMPEAA